MKYQSESVIKKDVQIFAKATRIERTGFQGKEDIMITLEHTVFPVPLKYFHGNIKCRGI